MTEAWFVEAVEEVTVASRQACLAIESAVSKLRAGCDAHGAGRDLVDVIDELIAASGRETRLSAADAFRDYERAVGSMRAGVVRALVDDGGLTLTEVARRIAISRQAAGRLYVQGAQGRDERPD